MKILAVDDSPSLLELLVSCLAEAGHDVVPASNGKMASEQLSTHTFDVIVSDLNMVVLGGLELLTIIRDDQNHSTCPFILLTTEIDGSLKDEARRLGATAWMAKPFDPERLRKLISSFEPL